MHMYVYIYDYINNINNIDEVLIYHNINNSQERNSNSVILYSII